MSYPLLNVIAIAAGGVAAIAGTVLYVIAAFRKSIVWGLVVLFVPFASLVFVCCHWREGRLGFLTSVAGFAVVFLSGVKIPELQSHFQFSMNGAPAPSARDLSAQIQEHRDQIDALQTTFAQEAIDLTKEYQTLETERKALKPGDTAAIVKFNEAAAAYQARNTRHKQVPEQIARTQQELSALMETRMRDQAAQAAQQASQKKVVLYTTSHCPYCTAAKQFLAQKGVPYEEIDVETSRDGAAAFQKLGGHGVPLIFVGEKRIDGFNQQALEAAL